MADPNTPFISPFGGFNSLFKSPGLSMLDGLFDFPMPGLNNGGSSVASGQMGPGGQHGPVAFGASAATGASLPAGGVEMAAVTLPPDPVARKR